MLLEPLEGRSLLAAVNDAFSTFDNQVLSGNVVGNDSPAGPVIQVNGSAAAVGAATVLSSGATVTLASNGSLSYNPATSASLRALQPGQSTVDTFTYGVGESFSGQLAQWQFNGTAGGAGNETAANLAASFTATNVTGSAITDSPGTTMGTESLTYPSNPVFRIDPGASTTTFAQAVANNRYFEFTVSPQPGGALSLANLEFMVARGGAGTVRGWGLRTSVDNFSSDVASAAAESVRPSFASVMVPLSGASFQNVAGPITFRVYVYAPGAGSTLEFDNITVNGTVITPSVATVSVTVNGTNVAPSAKPDSYSTNENTSATGNLVTQDTGSGADSDGDSDPVTVVAYDVTSQLGAAVTVAPDGTFTFNPGTSAVLQGQQSGSLSDTFRYTIADALDSFSAGNMRVEVYSGANSGLASADAVRAAGPANFTGTVNLVDFNDPENGNTAHFGSHVQPPGLGSSDDNNYAVFVTGIFDVGAGGTFTFGTFTDDSSRIRIDLNNDNVLATDGSETVVLQSGCCGDIFGAPVFIPRGRYMFEAVYSEGGGGSYGEFFYAPGSHTSFNSSFKLLGDASNGIAAGTGVTSRSTTTVTVVVSGIQEAPLATADTYATTEDAGLSIPALLEVPGMNVAVYDNTDSSIGSFDTVRASSAPTSTTTVQRADFLSAGNERFTVNNPVNYPLGSGENYAVLASGIMRVDNAGLYTFGAYGDDATRIRIDLNRDGIIASNGSEDVLLNTGCCGHLLGTAVNLPAGDYKFEAVYTEGGGGDYGEFYYTPGNYTSFNSSGGDNGIGRFDNATAAGATFRLIGDGSAGIRTFSSITHPALLGNDTDEEVAAGAPGQSLSVVALNGSASLTGTTALGAAITLNPDGSFSYNPNVNGSAVQALTEGATANDTFTYTVSDNHPTNPRTATATVTVVVAGQNDRRTGVVDSYAVSENGVLTASDRDVGPRNNIGDTTPGNTADDGVLVNDIDPDSGDLLEVVGAQGATLTGTEGTLGDGSVTVSSNLGASVTINDDGTFTYNPAPSSTLQALGANQSLVDTFTYTFTDGRIVGDTNLNASQLAGLIAGPSGQFYLLVTAGATFDQARFNASQLTYRGTAGKLVSLNSVAERNFVSTNLGSGDRWIGLTDSTNTSSLDGFSYASLGTAEAGSSNVGWRWLDGTPLDPAVANWGGGEPNNSGEEDVGQLRGDNFWNDHNGGPTMGADQDGGPTLTYIVEFNPIRATETVTVSVTVNGFNEAPIATADSYATTEDASLSIPALLEVPGMNVAVYDNTDSSIGSFDTVRASSAPTSTTTVQRADFLSAGNERFTVNNPVNYPLGSGENYAVLASGIMRVDNAGLYTFGAYGDDATRIRIDLNRDGIIASNGSEDVLLNTGCCGHLLGTAVNLPAGDYKFEAVYTEGGGGDYGEFYYTPGNYTSFNSSGGDNGIGRFDNATAAGATFRLIGDGSAGIRTFSSITHPALLGNDTDEEVAAGAPGQSLSVVALNGSASLTGTTALGAAITLNPDGSFSYNPNVNGSAVQALPGGVVANDTFTYTISDNAAADAKQATITVTIAVTGLNDLPVATNNSYTTTEDSPLVTTDRDLAPRNNVGDLTPGNTADDGVLVNDTEIDAPNVLEVTSINGLELSGTSGVLGDGSATITTSLGATVTLNDDGTFSYNPTGSSVLQRLSSTQSLVDSFTYRVTDGSTTGPLLWDFGLANLQGWKVLNGSVFFRPDEGGGLTPANGGGGFGHDPAHASLIVESPRFRLNGTTLSGSTVLRVEFAGGAGDQNGQGAGQFPNPAAVLAYNNGISANAGQKSLAFYNIATGQYDAMIFENDDGGQNLRSFTAAQLQALGVNLSQEYRLHYFENDEGGWGWGQINYIEIAGETLYESAPITVSITVNGVNDAPVAGAEAYQASENSLLSVPAVATPGMNVRVYGGTNSTIGSADLARATRPPGSATTVLLADFMASNNDHFAIDNPVASPGGGDSYAVFVTGFLRVTETGFYTFGKQTDDDGRIRVDLNRDSVIATDGSEDVTPTTGCCGDAFGAPRPLDRGVYAWEAVYTEGGGGDYGEFFYAPGSFTAFGSAFRLIGDATGGIESYSSLSGLLANDYDIDNGATLSAGPTTVLSALGAQVTIASDGSFTYDPAPSAAIQALQHGQLGADTFVYIVTDNLGAGTPRSVTVQVRGQSDVVGDAYTTAEANPGAGVTLASPTPGVLGNDALPGALPVQVGSVNGQAMPGAVGVNADGSLTVTTAGGATVVMQDHGAFTYDQNGALDHLDDGQSFIDSFVYTLGSITTSPALTTQGGTGGFTVSDTDLLRGLVAAVTGTALSGQENTSTLPSVLTDGSFGVAGATGGTQTLTIGNNTTLTYQLDLTASPNGYGISAIDVFTAWADAGRDNHNYVVRYSTVDNPGVFVDLQTVGFDPGGSNRSGRSSVAGSGGVLATRVAAVQFAFGNQENGYVGYREIDVVGFPMSALGPATVSIEVIGQNDAPVVDAGGAYTIHAGQSLHLDASGSYDVDSNDNTLTYRWDLDNNGSTDLTTTSATLTVPWQTLQALPGPLGVGTYTLGLKVSDGTVEVAATAQLTIDNVFVYSPVQDGSADRFELRLSDDGNTIEVRDPATNAVVSSVAKAGVNAISISGSSDNDTLFVNYTYGNPIPIGGASFDGGGGVDGLAVQAAAPMGSVHYKPNSSLGDPNANSGVITVGGRDLLFTRLAPVDIDGGGLPVLITPTGGNDVLSVANGNNLTNAIVPVGSQSAIVIAGTTGGGAFETAAVWNASTLTLDTAAAPGSDGNDTISLAALSGLGSTAVLNLTINTGAGSDVVNVVAGATVTLAGNLSVTTSGGLASDAGSTVVVGAVSVSQSGNTTLVGTVNAGSLTKLGAGTLSLGANNTALSGTTTVSAGALELLQLGSLGSSTLRLDGGTARLNPLVNVTPGGLRGDLYQLQPLGDFANLGGSGWSRVHTLAALNDLLLETQASHVGRASNFAINNDGSFPFDDLTMTPPAPTALGNDSLLAVFRGQINLQQLGTYSFASTSDDGALIFIDGVLVTNDNRLDGVQAAPGRVGTYANATVGWHDIVVVYYESSGNSAWNIQYDLPTSGVSYASIPAADLRSADFSPQVFSNNVVLAAAKTSTIELSGNGQFFQLNNLAPEANATLSVSSTASASAAAQQLRFGSTTLTADVNFNTATNRTELALGQVSDGSNTGVDLAIGGVGKVIFDHRSSASDLNGTALRLTSGWTNAIRSSLSGSTSDPLIGATIEFLGGNLGLQVAAGSGQITFSNPMTVTQSGTLAKSGSSNVDWNGTVSIPANRTLTLDTLVGSSLRKNSGVISGAGNLLKVGPSSYLTNVAHTYTGTTEIRQGTMFIEGNGPSGTNGVFGNATSDVVLGDTTGVASAAIRTNSGSALTVGRNIRVRAGSTGTASLGNNNTAGALTFAGGIVLEKTVVFDHSSGPVTVTGVISDNGGGFGVTKTNIGTLTLSNSNTYSGPTTIGAGTAGTVVVTASNALGTGVVSVLRNTDPTSTAQLQLSGGITLPNAINTSGPNTGSNPVLLNVSGVNTLTGVVSLVGGGGNSTYQSDSGTLVFTNFVGANNSPSGLPRTLILQGAGNFQFDGVIRDRNGAFASDTVSLILAGTGTTTLNAANSYTQPTTVNSGRLVVNGSTSAASAVVVNGSGILSGTGMIGGSVTVNATGSVSPGNPLAADTTDDLAIGGALNLGASRSLAIEIGGTAAGTFDQISASSVTLAGATLALADLAAVVDNSVSQSFLIVNNTGTGPINGTFAGMPEGMPVSVGGAVLYLSYLGGNGNDVVLSSQPVVFGTSGPDVVTIAPQADGNLQVTYSHNGGSSVSYTTTVPPVSFTFEGGGGDDLLVVQANGNSLPSGGIFFNGGSQDFSSRLPNSLGDVLQVVGSGQDAVYSPDGVNNPALDNDGLVTIAGQGTITFTNLEPVDMTGFGTVALDLPGGADNVVISQGFDAATGAIAALVLSGASGGVPFETLHAWNNGELVIDTSASDGNDTITISSAANAHGNINLTIETGTSTDLVSISGAATFSGVVTVDTQSIAFSALLTAAFVDLDANSGAISTAGSALDVAAATLVATATTGIDLDTAVADLTAVVSGAGNLQIDESDSLILSELSVANGFARVAAGGPLTVTASATLSVSGNASLSATSITLGDSAIDGVNFGSLTFSSAGAVVISEDSAMQLTGSSSAASAVLTSSGALTDSGSTLNLAGNLSVVGASITLGDGADVLNAGSLTFSSAGAVNLSEDSSTALAGTSTAGTLVLTSAADISDAAGTSVTVTGNATLTAAGVVLGDDVGDSTNFGSLTVVSAAGVSISEDSSLDLVGASSGVGSVVLSSTDGSFALPAGASLSVSGAGSDITLNLADDVVIGGAITAVDRLSINLDGGVADVGGSSLSIAATSVITTGGGATGGTVITGGAEADLFSFRPQTTTAFVVDGGAPVLPVTPGDVLDLDLSGFAAGSTILTLGPTAGSGSYSFAAPQSEQSVSYTSIETVDADITGGYHLVLDLGFSGLENGAADTVDARLSTGGGGANLELSVNSLPFFSGVAASIRSLTVIGSDDADTFTLTEVEGQLPSFVAAAPPVDNTAIGGGVSLGAHQNATSTAVLGAQAVTIHFAGGAGSNTVGLVLTSTDDATYFADTVGADQSGNLAVPADTLVSFAGAANLNLTGAGGSLTVDASSTPAVSAITLASPAAGQTSINGNVDLATSLAQGFAGLSVLGGDGAETIEVLAVGAGLTSLTLSGNNRAGTDAAADTLRVHTLPAGITTASLLGGAGSDTFQLYSSTSTVDGILSPVTVNGSDGNVGGNTDTLVVVDSGDADGDVVNITQNSLEGLTGYSGTPDVSYSNIDVLTVTATAGADTITTSLAAGSDLNVVTVNGNDSADQFYLSLPDPGAGPGSGIATVNLSGDAGNDSFGDATTKIQPSRTTAVNINGGAPTPGGLPTGNTVGDHLSLDLSAIPTTSAVIVTTVPGQVIASGYAGFSFADIEDLDLYDSTGLTTIEMGDLYARGTEQADSFVFTNGWLPEQPSLMRVMINSFGGYLTIPGKIVVYARGGNDYLTQHDTPRIAHFYGEGGNDYLAGALQADLLVGGLNDDQLLGSSGNDTIWGDEGPTPTNPAPQDDVAGGFDRINGGLGNDIIYAGGGNDQAFGNGDDDYLHGGQGDDTLDGGEGNDRLYGSAGNDQLSGYFGYDLLSGGEGNDILTGNSGNDVLIGGLGSDSLVGNDDSDLMVTGTTVPVGAGATSANSTAAGDANDQALLALLLAWGTTGTDRTLLGTVTQDGVYDEVFSGNGNDEITRDNPLDRLFDFTAGQDEEF